MTATENVPTLESIFKCYDARPENLIPILQDVQNQLGYSSEEAVNRIAEYLELSPNDVYGVATFYSQFRFHPAGRHHMKVCMGTACHVRRSAMILEALERKLGIAPGETTTDREYSLESVACFGSCALAPVVVLDDKVYGRMTTRKTEKLIEGHR
jgi:NADH:ubiquinone oxidoreductase subunit E